MVPEHLDWLNSTITSGSAASSGSSQPPASSGLPPTPPLSLNTQAAAVPDPQKLKWFREYFRPHFDDWVIGPINRLVSSQHALIGFIFMTCTIDYLAGFQHGKETNGKRYQEFIKEYFPVGRYKPDKLWDCLRNGLVHNFTIQGKEYTLTHNHPEVHLKADSHGQKILSAGDFRDDLITAKNRYFDDVEAKPDLLENLHRRYTIAGFLDLVPFGPTNSSSSP